MSKEKELELQEKVNKYKYTLVQRVCAAKSDHTNQWILTSQVSGFSFRFNDLESLEKFTETNDYDFHGFVTRRSFMMATMNEKFSD